MVVVDIFRSVALVVAEDEKLFDFVVEMGETRFCKVVSGLEESVVCENVEAEEAEKFEDVVGVGRMEGLVTAEADETEV